MNEDSIKLARMALARLERISADSYWAHRASGVRGSLLRALEKIENGETESLQTLKDLTEIGFRILAQSASELTGKR